MSHESPAAATATATVATNPEERAAAPGPTEAMAEPAEGAGLEASSARGL